MTMREDVVFRSGTDDCAAWLYLPETMGDGAKVPAVALAHGLGAIRDLYLEPFAKAFAAAGIAALLFDYRYFGASGGNPRQQVFPAAQIEDYRNALTWLSLHERIDAARLGVWGTSLSGGHVLHLGAYDPRVKAVVSQVAGLDIYRTSQALLPPEALAMFDTLIGAERMRGYTDSEPSYFPLAAPDGQPALQSNTETYEWLMAAQRDVAPHFENRVTVASVEQVREHAPGLVIDRIAPVALLMILATDDAYTTPDLLREAFARAGEPKRLIELAGGHYTVYDGPGQQPAAAAAVEWFTRYLVKAGAA